MYEIQNIDNQEDIIKKVNTRFYYCLPKEDIEIDPLFIPIYEDRDKNFIFLNTNYTDNHYLLNSKNPSIGNEAKLVLTNYELEPGLFDIAFISNKEDNAEDNYEWLKSLNLKNRIFRVKNVDGRNKAYKKAAELSKTRYFFAVFGKLRVMKDFDFTFNVMEFDSRHYVFRSINPVNGLRYGHQGIILYNKEKVLENPGTSIDFTMAQLYRELPIISAIANYNYSPLSAWRTAFRESLKLCLSDDKICKERLKVWQTGFGENSVYSIQGAKDAIDFYDNNKDDPDMLQKSYEWKWLEKYFRR